MKNKIDFAEIDNARRVLGLGEEAYIKDIKSRHRELVLKYHPDKCSEKNKKEYKSKFIEVQNAYEILMEFCLGYRFSFRSEEVEKVSPDKDWHDHIDRFYSEFFGEREKK